MLDEIRTTHDSHPTDEEQAWMGFDPIATAARIGAVIVLAFAIAGYVSYTLESPQRSAVAKH
ncbi:MAG TPA: hypothetical protein VH040_12555 [Usitatibacter sp.]|jgi:hypothetical protein|nr:hypothetical protein [Usitatibacter sp.]